MKEPIEKPAATLRANPSHLSFIFFLLILSQHLFAFGPINTRGYEKKFERAEQLYKGGSYMNALSVYLELYEMDSTNMNICYKTGDCYLKTGNGWKKAIYFLGKASSAVSKTYIEGDVKERNSPIETVKLLGDAYHLNYEFDKAISTYEKFKQLARSHSIAVRDMEKDADRKIKMCSNAKELMAHPCEVKIINMGKNLNSKFADYAPRLTADQSTMIFTSRRPENTGGKTYGEGQYFEDIYISTKKNGEWQTASNIGSPINTVGNEAAIAISADGQEILIYKDDMGDGNIYSSKLEGDKWSMPVKLNPNINSRWWEPSAFISADGKTLFFVSDRPGGYGGSDIYKSKKMPTGDWGRAINLGPVVNTPFDEHSPYLHPDGVTLFFSSKGHKTMGGYDVFFSRTLQSDERVWEQPQNVGYPINTPQDDAFYMVSPDKQKAYYASEIEGGFGEKDNYMVTFGDVKPAPLSLLTGVVVDTSQNAAKNVKITVTDNETNEVLAVYNTNSKTGKYSFVLTPGKNHNITYEADGYLFYSENRHVSPENPYYETNIAVKLEELAVGSKVTLNNIFFDFDATALKPYSKTELNHLHDFLTKNPKLSVEVAGFADSKGKDDYNKKLSLERARSVVEYLAGKGIGRNRMTFVGYGSSGATTNPNEDGSGRQYDRRVELKITAIK